MRPVKFNSLRPDGSKLAFIPPDQRQSRCAICDRPFLYWPKRDEVMVSALGEYVHKNREDCEGT